MVRIDGWRARADRRTSSHVEPLWHAWLAYAVDTPPTQDTLVHTNRTWASAKHIPSYSFTRGAYKPYSTYV